VQVVKTQAQRYVRAILNRAEVLLFALMKSENPAAAALASTYPGGRSAFVAAMNAKARQLGMNQPIM
jgi:D-alanyl-D-alanine endopeptidase (penicillin-binding protein 7)